MVRHFQKTKNKKLNFIKSIKIINRNFNIFRKTKYKMDTLKCFDTICIKRYSFQRFTGTFK